ncbi:MAG: M48 family metallopeptidase [Blastocatellia bacterium]|nr:M48 family metallopeptidase [Blastocatellia bacterium]
MTEQEFAQKVESLEAFAREHPTAYKIRAVLLACLGYGYLVAVALGLLLFMLLLVGLVGAGTATLVLIRAVIPLAQTSGKILQSISRAFWIKGTPPEGIEIRPAEAPELFAFIRRARKALNTPRLHHVIVTDEFNAAIRQIPRLGPFGWTSNYLVIGLPLMQALSPEQFESVLAHEMGHLSRAHSRLTGWIYRIRLTWATLSEQLDREGDLDINLIQGFVHWYAPYFNAYTFVLARMQEYEADQAAATMVGVRATSEALIETEIKSQFLSQSYWPKMFGKVKEEPVPPSGVFHEIPTAFRSALPEPLVTSVLKGLLATKTDFDDTHPALHDRLTALGFMPPTTGNSTHWSDHYQPAPLKESAAQALLGSAYQPVIRHYEQDWLKSVEPDWNKRHERIQKGLHKLAELEAKAAAEPELNDQDLWEYAALTTRLREADAGLPLLTRFLERHPEDSDANLLYGECLLEKDDPAGIGYIERAIEKNHHHTFAGCDVVLDYCQAHQMETEFEKFRLIALRHQDRLGMARKERSRVTPDELYPHRVHPEDVQALCQQLAAFPQIEIAYLAEKEVRYFPDVPFLVLGVVANLPGSNDQGKKAADQLLHDLTEKVEYPYETFVLLLGWHNQGFSSRFEAINARIYSKR